MPLENLQFYAMLRWAQKVRILHLAPRYGTFSGTIPGTFSGKE